jgi:hypothetical protein
MKHKSTIATHCRGLLGLYNIFFNSFLFYSADLLNLLSSNVSFARTERVYRKKIQYCFELLINFSIRRSEINWGKILIKHFTIFIILVNTVVQENDKTPCQYEFFRNKM